MIICKKNENKTKKLIKVNKNEIDFRGHFIKKWV
jgi:hypothetical protein